MTDKSVVVYLAANKATACLLPNGICHDAGVHSACIVRWPGVVKPGSVSDALENT